MRLLRKYDCEDCGKPTARIRAAKQPRICEDCSIIRLASNIRQIHERNGAGYDKWRARMAEWAKSVDQQP